MQTNPYAPGKKRADTKIVVAMSGGVDSSTVAALLADEGYQVVGVTLQLYDLGVDLEKKGACCAGQDIYDAKQVADEIGFPHYVLNYESIFKESVIEEFADSYIRGETPIPCVRCNQSVKFRDLFKVAKDLDADALATGHYVKRVEGDKGAELHQAEDPGKDQSYFLFATTQEQLNFLHFPLGGRLKEQTRDLALSYDLKVADKPDSQDICFVPNGSYASIVEKMRPGALDKGQIVHINGEILAEHDGIINYTVGQRRGLKIGWHEPLYVVKLNANENQVIVGPESALYSEKFTIKEVNWLEEAKVTEAHIKLRHQHKGIDATIIPLEDNRAEVKLHEAQRAITPGQACVFYSGSRVLGGGWIERDD